MQPLTGVRVSGFYVPDWFPAAPPPSGVLLFRNMINVDDRLLNELDESEMYLVLHIAKHMTANRMTAWPSIPTLAKACKWDERTVKTHRQSLIDKGFLSMKTTPGKPTQYRFLKDGIGIYHGLNTDNDIAENEGTEIEGGTNFEGAFFVPKGVQNLRGEVVNKEVINVERADQEKNPLSPAESSSLEAETLEGDNLPGGVLAEIHDGETGATVYDLIPPAPVTDPPAHRIELGDRPTAETPTQLQKNLEAFYAEPDWQNEWDDGVCRISGVWIPDSPQKEARLKSILSDFCDHAIKTNQQRDTYRQLNAAFQQWVKRERYATWKQPKQAAQPKPQTTNGQPAKIRQL